MNTLKSPAQLDDACPYPIESRELLQWTSLDNLERDFAIFRNEINQLDTRIKIESEDFKKLKDEMSRKLADIFVIPARAGLAAKDIIDLRLSAYIRVLEFILRGKGSMSGLNIWTRLLNLLDNSPSIIDSFGRADGTPDVCWFFKNRVMPFLLRKSSIHHSNLHEPYSRQLDLNLSHLTFLKNHSLYIDEDDCFVIMKDIIFPKLRVVEQTEYHQSVDCADVSENQVDECAYVAIMQSLVNRHESVLQKSFQFSMKQFHGVGQRDQAKRLLYILFRVAHDRNKLELLNATLASLLFNPTTDMRAFATRLFARLVGWDNSRDGTIFEMLSEHSNTMIELLESSSDNANHIICSHLGSSVRLKPREYQLLREVFSIHLKRVDRITQEGLSGQEPGQIRKEFETLCWLIMPKANNNTGKFDFTSTSDQLAEDLNVIMQKEVIPDSFYTDFQSVCEIHGLSLTPDESRYQFGLICDKASWLIVKKLTDSSRSTQDRDHLVSFYMTSNMSGGQTWVQPGRLSLANHLNFCEILLEIHQYFYDPKQILEPQRCLRFLRVLEEVGPSQYNEEKSKTIESCLLRAIELHPRQRSQFFRQAFKILDVSEPALLLRSAHMLSYHENRKERIILYSRGLYHRYNDIQGIQSRRMLLVSFCKYLIAGLDFTAISTMINLLSELDLAYRLRAEQRYSELDKNLSLMPSCVELAFPTPFDDPNNPMYICEFAYFRDTMDHLRRNNPRLLDHIYPKLSLLKKGRLDYYQNDYNNFDVCCSTRRLDKERDRFRCIDHKIDDQEEIRICPLLNRYQYCNHIKY